MSNHKSAALKPFYDICDVGVRLYVRAQPGAARDEIAGIWEGSDERARLAVKVAAPPDKGKANAALIKLLAKALDMPKSALTVAAGEASRLKTIEIRGVDTVQARALGTKGLPPNP